MYYNEGCPLYYQSFIIGDLIEDISSDIDNNTIYPLNGDVEYYMPSDVIVRLQAMRSRLKHVESMVALADLLYAKQIESYDFVKSFDKLMWS